MAWNAECALTGHSLLLTELLYRLVAIAAKLVRNETGRHPLHGNLSID
jgi:hypothetical protein